MTNDEIYEAAYGPVLISTRDAENHYGVPMTRVWGWRARGRISPVHSLTMNGPVDLYPLARLMLLNDTANADQRAKPEPAVLLDVESAA